jgi:polo-like kinase 1
LFNDSTKIITHPNLFHFDYIDRVRGAEESEKVSEYNFYDFPESINKKVVLLQHFKSYLDGN